MRDRGGCDEGHRVEAGGVAQPPGQVRLGTNRELERGMSGLGGAANEVENSADKPSTDPDDHDEPAETS